MFTIAVKVTSKRHPELALESIRQGLDSRFRGNDMNTMMEVIPGMTRNPEGKAWIPAFAGIWSLAFY